MPSLLFCFPKIKWYLINSSENSKDVLLKETPSFACIIMSYKKYVIRRPWSVRMGKTVPDVSSTAQGRRQYLLICKATLFTFQNI